jgi:hypothetical protein
MRLARIAASLALLSLLGAGAAVAQTRTIARTPHRTLNKDNCLGCHGVGANAHIKSVPTTGHNYTNAMCTRCHRPETTMPSRPVHALDAAHTRCGVCHVPGNPVSAKPTPASHVGRDATTCGMCHEPQQPGQ